jgi:hypothetical protein
MLLDFFVSSCAKLPIDLNLAGISRLSSGRMTLQSRICLVPLYGADFSQMLDIPVVSFMSRRPLPLFHGDQ